MTNSAESVVRSYFDRMGAGDGKGAFALLAPDVTYRVMGTTPISRTVHGSRELVSDVLRPFIARLEGGKIDLLADEFIVAGSTVVVLAHSVATGATGLPYENEYAMLFRVGEGLIT